MPLVCSRSDARLWFWLGLDAVLFDSIAERSEMKLLSMASRREVSWFGGFGLIRGSYGGSIDDTFTRRAAFLCERQVWVALPFSYHNHELNSSTGQDGEYHRRLNPSKTIRKKRLPHPIASKYM